MGLRGPKPIDMGLLSLWEFEFHKAFRSLRDGIATKPVPPSGFTKQELRNIIGQLKRMTDEKYWLTTRRLSGALDKPLNLKRPLSDVDRWWAERERDAEIRSLEKELDPPELEDQVHRRKIWVELLRAKTYPPLRKACRAWAKLPDVRRSGMTAFPDHVLENAAQFLLMKENKRFPVSNYGDDGRIDYLSRGMAGVLVGRSAMTGIERLRNMKHAPGGPFWVTRQGEYVLQEKEQHCGCWRCRNNNWDTVARLSRTGYENGLRAFTEIAAQTKVPDEWIIKGKKF